MLHSTTRIFRGLGVLTPQIRLFSRSAALASPSNRAIVYSQHGNPSEVLDALTFPGLPPPPPSTVNVKFLLSPINPADINVVEGVYPTKPFRTTSLAEAGKGSTHVPVFVGGNEGLAQVVDVGRDVTSLKTGDWVVMSKQQLGTWVTCRNVGVHEVLKVPRTPSLSQVQAATITVNPPTAYNMLHEFVDLQEGDWVIQNGANSAVGQSVIQIAAAKGLKTLNLVRNRDDFSGLAKSLRSLGATEVLTYDELEDKSVRDKIKTWTAGRDIRLGLNCVGGRETTLMARLLGNNAHLVSYGAMSRQPLALPASLFIFKNLTAHGFWQSQWYAKRSTAQQEALLETLVQLMANGKLQEPDHEILTIEAHEKDETAGRRVRDIMRKISEGQYGKKVLLNLEAVQD